MSTSSKQNSGMSRPDPIERSISASRPSLIADIRREVLAARWTVSDSSLHPVPPLYPPLNPRCTVFVGDAPPSEVAFRISECLRKRSIVAEFDEQSVCLRSLLGIPLPRSRSDLTSFIITSPAIQHTATCMTMDRVHFLVNLYRGNRRTADEHEPDVSYGVIVECLRVRGDTISFHYNCRAILNAALGKSDGVDRRKHPSPMEVPSEKTRPCLKRARPTSSGLTGLEDALGLLKKDRICAQRLGLESLVMLTDENTSGRELAVFCSLAVLGAEPSDGVHTWIMCLLEDRMSPGEQLESTIPISMELTAANLSGGSAASSADATLPEIEEAYHGGVLRTLALRAFANSLFLLGRDDSEMLRSILSEHSPQLVSESFLAALVEDLDGAFRPSAVVARTRLASPHEAALAAMCLRILAEHSETATRVLASEQVLDSLDRAQQAGRASHFMLAQESDRALALLSRDVQTC